MPTIEELQAALETAKVDLFEWATGVRSTWNDMLNSEQGFEYRTQTLANIAVADAATVHAARERVLGLQLLIESRVGRKTPPEPVIHRVRQEPPWPPSPEATYNLTRWKCICGWEGDAFADLKGGIHALDREGKERLAREHEGTGNA